MIIRSGIGFDFHPRSAPDASRPLHVACLEFSDDFSLAGHSDADPAAHAACDALLSAAGLGDLGAVFGTNDPELAGATGESLLQRSAALVTAAGWTIEHVAVQVIALAPHLASRRGAAEQIMSAVVGAPVTLAASSGNTLAAAEAGVTALATAVLTREN